MMGLLKNELAKLNMKFEKQRDKLKASIEIYDKYKNNIKPLGYKTQFMICTDNIFIQDTTVIFVTIGKYAKLCDVIAYVTNEFDFDSNYKFIQEYKSEKQIDYDYKHINGKTGVSLRFNYSQNENCTLVQTGVKEVPVYETVCE